MLAVVGAEPAFYLTDQIQMLTDYPIILGCICSPSDVLIDIQGFC
jgi:hypothetical protein